MPYVTHSGFTVVPLGATVELLPANPRRRYVALACRADSSEVFVMFGEPIADVGGILLGGITPIGFQTQPFRYEARWALGDYFVEMSVNVRQTGGLATVFWMEMLAVEDPLGSETPAPAVATAIVTGPPGRYLDTDAAPARRQRRRNKRGVYTRDEAHP